MKKNENYFEEDNLPNSLPINNRMKNLSGQVINNIQALFPYDKTGDGKYKWICKCLYCNSYFGMIGTKFTQGTSKSCGCLKSEDLTGKVFGKLTVRRPAPSLNKQESYWYCDCECGRKNYPVKSRNLKEKRTKSCGCLLKRAFDSEIVSSGETTLEKILIENNIEYYREYSFPDLKGDYKELRFDFFLPKYNLLIELQGQQHYEPVLIFGGEDSFKKQQKYDNKKRNYCKDHNIKLLEISYKDYNIISLEYLKHKLGGDLNDNCSGYR